MKTRGRWASAIRDALDGLAVVWAIPLAMLLVGAPIALGIAAVLWLGRWARAAF